jgi:hypothetical protein
MMYFPMLVDPTHKIWVGIGWAEYPNEQWYQVVYSRIGAPDEPICEWIVPGTWRLT